MKTILLTATLLLLTAQAKANIICSVKTDMGPATIEVADHYVTVSGAALSQPHTYTALSPSYDGHMTSMLAGAGFAMSWENWFGVAHNATIITNFRDGSTQLIEAVTASICQTK